MRSDFFFIVVILLGIFVYLPYVQNMAPQPVVGEPPVTVVPTPIVIGPPGFNPTVEATPTPNNR